MTKFKLGYREVIPDQTVLGPWKEISVNTGGTQGTLQDIKVAESAKGFCYRDSGRQYMRNRFIYWRINHDVLELVEHSLDINLAGNRIRYKFVDTPVLDGVSIHETYDNVVILVPTVCSVHRLIFPHPDKYHRQDEVLGTHPDLAVPSIFSEETVVDVRDPTTFHFFMNSSTSSSQLPYLADSSLTLGDEEAIFVLAYPSGEILLVKQSREGKIDSADLKNTSIVPRFLSGLTDKLRQKDKDGDTTVSLLLHSFGLETYALTLTRNGQLKFWSCSKAECMAVIDVVSEILDVSRNQIQGAHNHILRKAVDGFDSDCVLAIFMSFHNESQFHIIKPIVNGSQIRITRLNSLRLDQNDLISFSLSTNQIWSVWRGKSGECEVYTSDLTRGSQLTPVVLDDIPDAREPPTMDGETDPRQVYLQHIFYPGRFPLHVISKALNIFKRSPVTSDVNLSTSLLKQQICIAVEEEIQNELKDSIITDDDYVECANDCWQRFYSCCVQYQVAGLKLLGLLLFPESSAAVLLKKSSVSFLRPLDIFEHMIFNTDCIYRDQFDKHMLLTENFDITDDVASLFQVISYLNQQMSEIFAYTFQKELMLLKSPDLVMAALFEKILDEMDSEFTDHVARMLSECGDLYQAMHKVLELLRVEDQVESDSNHGATVSHIFTSQLGVSMVTGCLKQQAETRFTICRNLLLISNILLERKELDSNVLEAIQSVCNPEIVVLTQANFVTVWLASLPAIPHVPTETAMRRLSSLKLSPVFNLRTNNLNSISLLELFAGSTGGYEARKAFSRMSHDQEGLTQWHTSLLPYLNNLFHVVWPVSGSPVLPEWLLSCGQHLWLQQYVRLVSNWCEWNRSTHSFLLATSLLTFGEFYKAQILYELAAEGIFTDPFFTHKGLCNIGRDGTSKAIIGYYLKVIHLFELHKALDCAIHLANEALSVADPHEPLAATLYSIKFKHHLDLKNYKMAYDSLICNPDSDRKKDNLRDLVKKLLDERKLDVLMSFSYGNMEELFCNIIFTRARASDALNNFYYEFLYAYLVKRGATFFRLAASVMYEQAFRLSQVNSPDALEKEVKCLLAAKNSLQLCDPQYAYIVTPVEQSEDVIVTLPPLAGSRDDPEVIKLRKQVNIINLEAIKKNLEFSSAKLRLFRLNSRNFYDITTPGELVVLMTSAGLFRRALCICDVFHLSNHHIFEILTRKCASMSKGNDPIAWKWLIENDLQNLSSSGCQSPSQSAWDLLKNLLMQYEQPNLSVLHKVVSKQIIKMHLFLPQWLLDSYKKLNPSELFRLFYTAGRLEEASEFACEFMLAALGYGKEYFGFTHALQATQPALCLPIRGFDSLIQQLEYLNETNPEQPYLKHVEELKDVFQTYLETAQRTSNEMCIFKSRNLV